jgi:hypothetical protein
MSKPSDLPEEATHDVLEQADSLLLHQLVDHVAEYGTDSVEALVSLTDVGKPNVVKEDLLNDEDSHSLAEL